MESALRSDYLSDLFVELDTPFENSFWNSAPKGLR